MGLNFKDLVAQEPVLPAEGAAARPQLRHPGQQQGENFELQWQMLRVQFPPQQGCDAGLDLKDRGMRFKPAVPLPEFLAARAKAARVRMRAGGGAMNFKNMSKAKRKRVKQHTKLARAAAAAPSDAAESFLFPSHVPRCRLFLCYHSDVQPDGQLPAVHAEIDPFRPLAQSAAEFEAAFSGHRCCCAA